MNGIECFWRERSRSEERRRAQHMFERAQHMFEWELNQQRRKNRESQMAETARAEAAEKQIKRLKILIKETATSVKALRDAAVELVRLGDGRGDPLSLLIKMDVLKVALRATGRLPPDLED